MYRGQPKNKEHSKQAILGWLKKININTTSNQVTVTSSLMTYPRCLSRLSACEAVSILDSFTGRYSRKPSGVYGFKSVSMCQIAVRSIRQMAIIAFLWPQRAFIRR